MRQAGFSWTAFLWMLPLLLLIGHALLFLDYLVDDAAISFAYSRNLAAGHGLVSQPGMPPVEAYSNALWVFLMAIPYVLGWHDPYASAWVLSIICLIMSGWICWQVLGRHYLIPVLVRTLMLSLIATSAPMIRWSVSGMENGVYVLGLTALWAWLVVQPATVRNGWIAGLLVGMVALIRPDGVLYIGLVGLWSLLMPQQKFVRTVAFVTGLVVTLGAYLAFRQIYFDDWWPMPYYAKQDTDLLQRLSLEKWHQLFRSVVGPAGALFGLAMCLGTGWYIRTKEMRVKDWILVGCWLIGILIFFILPYDHLGWYRYATPFMLCQYLWGGVLAYSIWQKVIQSSPSRLLFGKIALGIVVLAHLGMWTIVTRHHLEEPIVPFEGVAQMYGTGFNRLGDMLDVTGEPILIPDAGGAIYFSNMEVHDIIGLLDPTLAKTFWKDNEAYTRYIVEDLRPVLIHVHGSWAATFFPQHSTSFQRAYPVLFARNLQDPIARESYYLRRDIFSRSPIAVQQVRDMLENQAEIQP